MLLILFFIIVLNIIAIGLTYYCLDNMEKKEKMIFIAVGIAITYMLTSLVYWISTKNVSVKEVSETGKNIITFMFVPINGILILPILAKSYAKYERGRLEIIQFRNRCIVLAFLALIVLVLECSYFKDIQNGVIEMIKNNKEEVIQTQEKKSDSNIINDISVNAIEEHSLNTLDEDRGV